MLKYIIFDFDGTLADSKEVAMSAYNRLAERHGFNRMNPEDLEHFRALSIAERCRFLRVPMFRIPFLAGEFYGLYQESMKHLTLFPGMKELLKELSERGYGIAVISSNSEQNIRDFIHKHSLDIEQVICSSHIYGKDKMLRSFLKKNRLVNTDVIYIGDEHRDIMACKKIGIPVIWVNWGLDLLHSVAHASPDFIVETPEEILRIVESYRKK
ncbi:MAG TPA: HAD-IA family hydrolase [Bacillota bacterium]|nr:HAD-IA family hydrolase [Bacillota bacterium]HPT88303.1 HAD-IA family hydrolase [Bacillota bacterium]